MTLGNLLFIGKASGRSALHQFEVIPGVTGQRTLKVEVTQVSETATKADAPAMYRELP